MGENRLCAAVDGQAIATEENPLFYRFDTRPTFGMEIKTNELERTRSNEIWRWSSGQNHDNGYFQSKNITRLSSISFNG